MVPDTIFAPAKLNLHLSVLDKRSDGFHNLESIFLAVDLCDTLHFEPSGNVNLAEIQINWDENIKPEEIPLEKNIIYKTLSLFREKTGYVQGFKIDVEKKIPAGSGLGGGSSDAASALLFINEFAGFPLKQQQLYETAGMLGSDVPFFIRRTAAALVTGRGECITPINAPDCFIVLVNPGFPSDTASAFNLLDEYRIRENLFKTSRLSDFDSQNHLFRLFSLNLQNDFLDILPEKKNYYRIIGCLKEAGAEFAGLSGTGSTCFGIFFEKMQAQKAVVYMNSEYRFVKCCNIVY